MRRTTEIYIENGAGVAALVVTRSDGVYDTQDPQGTLLVRRNPPYPDSEELSPDPQFTKLVFLLRSIGSCMFIFVRKLDLLTAFRIELWVRCNPKSILNCC